MLVRVTGESLLQKQVPAGGGSCGSRSLYGRALLRVTGQSLFQEEAPTGAPPLRGGGSRTRRLPHPPNSKVLHYRCERLPDESLEATPSTVREYVIRRPGAKGEPCPNKE